MHSTQEDPSGSEATGASFFASIRRAGIVRTQDRWGGGVAGGLARRFNIDPAIMRGVFVVVSLFSGVGLLVYGLCWALLPEESDGRIHLEEAMAGRFDAALAAAGAAVVIGLARPGFWFAPFGAGGAWGVFVAIIAVGAVIALIAVAHARTVSDRESADGASGSAGWSSPAASAGYAWTADASSGAAGATAPAQPPATGAAQRQADPSQAPTDSPTAGETATNGPAAPGMTSQAGPGTDTPPPLWSGQPQPAAMGAAATAGGAAGGPGGAPWAGDAPWAAQPHQPTRWRRSAPGYRIVLFGLAGVFLVVAAVLFAWFSGYLAMSMPPLVMAGGALVFVGAVIAVAGLMGRRGGWLTLVAIAALIASFVLVVLGLDSYGSRTLRWDESHTVSHATATYRVTSATDVDGFEDWFASQAGEPVILDLTPLAGGPETQSLDLGEVTLTGANDLRLQIAADAPFELRVTGQDAWIDAWDTSGVRAEAVRTVDNWSPDQWVLGAGGAITFTSAIAGDPLRLHLDVPNSSTTIDFVQEQS